MQKSAVIYEQFDVSLLNKSIKILLTPNFFNSCVEDASFQH